MAKDTSDTFAGILNINKPAGMTSHDVVNRIRRLSGQRRVGHAGTLDPLATGVLVICAGWATRLSEYLMDGRKGYRGIARLGAATDTYDAEGSIVSESSLDGVTMAQITVALENFRGKIEQVPPIYSAIKHKGTPLYKLARQGKTVARKGRLVHIYELTIVDWNLPHIVLDIVCSKGTYIRSLIHDLGQEIGCGAHLTALTRLFSGPFRLEDAVSLENLAEAFSKGDEKKLLYPIQTALEGFDMLAIDDETARRIQQGQAIDGAPGENSFSLALSSAGEPLAVLKYNDGSSHWQPIKVFK